MVGRSLRVLRLSPPLKLVAMNIAEILLKVALSSINVSYNSNFRARISKLKNGTHIETLFIGGNWRSNQVIDENFKAYTKPLNTANFKI